MSTAYWEPGETDQLGRVEAKLDRILALLEPKPKKERKRTETGYSSAFLQIWEIYPKRAGSNPKGAAWKAYKARAKEGNDIWGIGVGVQRYKAFCDATGKTGTEYVMQGSRFFGPGREWENDWAIPVQEVKPQTEEEWYALAEQRGVQTRPGESWAGFKARIMEAK